MQAVKRICIFSHPFLRFILLCFTMQPYLLPLLSEHLQVLSFRENMTPKATRWLAHLILLSPPISMYIYTAAQLSDFLCFFCLSQSELCCKRPLEADTRPNIGTYGSLLFIKPTFNEITINIEMHLLVSFISVRSLALLYELCVFTFPDWDICFPLYLALNLEVRKIGNRFLGSVQHVPFGESALE